MIVALICTIDLDADCCKVKTAPEGCTSPGTKAIKATSPPPTDFPETTIFFYKFGVEYLIASRLISYFLSDFFQLSFHENP